MKTAILISSVLLLAACTSATDSGTHKTASATNLSDIAPAAGTPVTKVYPCGPHRFCGNN